VVVMLAEMNKQQVERRRSTPLSVLLVVVTLAVLRARRVDLTHGDHQPNHHVTCTRSHTATTSVNTTHPAQPISTRYPRYTHTHPFNGPLSGTTRVSRYQKGKTNLDFTEAKDSEWLWHQLGHMQVCTSLQTDNHARTPSLSFLQARCPSCRPTNSVKALKATTNATNTHKSQLGQSGLQ